MAQFNRIILIGKILDEPDVKVTTEGKSIAKFNIEVERPFGDKKDCISIVSWEKIAEIAGEFSKGQDVLVEGRIQQRTFEDEDGSTVWVTEVVASLIRGFGSEKTDCKSSSKEEDTTEDDIPF